MKLGADTVIITVLYYLLLYSWKLFFPTARALIGYFDVTWHLTWRFNNETVSRQHLWAGNIAKVRG